MSTTQDLTDALESEGIGLEGRTMTAQESKGHLGWSDDGKHELAVRDGEVFVASVSNCIEADGYRPGRWEGSLAHVSHYHAIDATILWGGAFAHVVLP